MVKNINYPNFINENSSLLKQQLNICWKHVIPKSEINMYHQRKLKIQIHLATKLAFQKQQRKQTVTLLQNLAE